MMTLIACEKPGRSNKAHAFMSGDALCKDCIAHRSAQRPDKSRKPLVIELGSAMPEDMVGAARMVTKLADVLCPNCLLKVVEIFKAPTG